MLADKILRFYSSLTLDAHLPEGVTYMNPFRDENAFEYTRAFYQKFYHDNNTRTLILGINPGRFGGGITGIPFTDPIKLGKFCGIENPLQKKAELSADFIYAMIAAYGGAKKFYSRYFISALSPLGFIRDGKNLNYYDIRELQEAVEPFMVECIHAQLSFGLDRSVCFCLGEGENYRYLAKLNEQHRFFQAIEPLAHPRFVMQYKRKQLDHYIAGYLEKFRRYD